MDLENKTAAEISNIIVSTEKAIQIEIDRRGVVNNDIYILTRKMLEEEIQKKGLMIAKSKASDNIRKLELDKSILKTAFWASRESGL